ncbi:MAG: SAM-dependent methyltransferase [Pseudomonadota bacterium]
MSLAAFMQACLTDPEHGYYTTGNAIGRSGDFITAPEVSQIFGELIGLFFADFWQRSGAPTRLCLVELGPGRGTLMADLLRAGSGVAGFRKAIDLHLVEVSPVLRQSQADVLQPHGIQPTWHDTVTDVPDQAPLFLIANEFFDALPARQWERTDKGWRERMVVDDPATGQLALRPVGSPPDYLAEEKQAPLGAIRECQPAARPIMAEIASRVTRSGGIALIIDYGYVGPADGDTFQALRDHRFADPLADPGKADLTVHVDFTPLMDEARLSKAALWGPVDQGSFLTRLGLGARAAALHKHASEKAARDVASAANRLVAPDQMGGLFKVLAITGSSALVPAGFA